MKTDSKKKRNILNYIFSISIAMLWGGAILANLKSIFTDYNVDNAYALATSYRHVKGDQLFLQMWEPHQTSSFLADILTFVFLKIRSGNPDYLTLWLHFSGTVLYFAVTLALYFFLKERIDKRFASFTCIVFFTMRAKQIVFPEFSNMMIGFSVLVFISLIRYLEEERKIRQLVMAALFLCFEILSYPTSILTFFSVIVLLAFFSQKKFKSIFVFSLVCFLCGFLYVGYFSLRIGLGQFADNLFRIVNGDNSHDFSRMNQFTTGWYYRDVLFGISMILVSVLIACAVILISRRKDFFLAAVTFAYMILETFASFYICVKGIFGLSVMFTIVTFYVFLMIYGALCIKSCKADEIRIFVTGLLISFPSFLAVLILTNETLITVLSYLILAALVSLIPIYKRAVALKSQGCFVFFYALCMMFIIHRGINYQDLSGPTNIKMLFSYMRFGPSKGIVCSYWPYYENYHKYEDWNSRVKTTDSVLVVSPLYSYNAEQYLYVDCNVSHYSTICSPTYNETLMDYWNEFPDKYPTVIVLEAEPSEGTWIKEFIDENYELDYEGYCSDFYRRK